MYFGELPRSCGRRLGVKRPPTCARLSVSYAVPVTGEYGERDGSDGEPPTGSLNFPFHGCQRHGRYGFRVHQPEPLSATAGAQAAVLAHQALQGRLMVYDVVRHWARQR